MLRVFFLLLSVVDRVKPVSVTGQRLDYCLFVFCHVLLMVAAVVAVAVLVAKYFFLETFAVQFQAL